MGAYEEGEIKHETCRFGIFAQQAFRLDDRGGQTPFAMPLCGWEVPSDAPPALKRRWGGSIEFERDCAVCPAHQEIAP